MPTNDKNGSDACLELNFADLQVVDASISHGPDGGLFTCKLGPVSDALLASLEMAVQSRNRVRLVFPDNKITFARVDLRHHDEGWLELIGQLDASTPKWTA